MSFSDRLRETRELKGLTQQELADSAGMTRAGYARYENGSSLPNVDALKSFCEKLEISADYLLGIQNNKPVTYRMICEAVLFASHSVDGLLDKISRFGFENNPNIYNDYSAGVLVLFDYRIAEFFDGYKKMKQLEEDKTISAEVMRTWLNGKLIELDFEVQTEPKMLSEVYRAVHNIFDDWNNIASFKE